MNCAKLAEPIEVPFGMCTLVGPRKRILDGVHNIGATCRTRFTVFIFLKVMGDLTLSKYR